MRFFAEDLGRIRRGELTAALRPYEGRPISFKPADRFTSGLYAIEAVSDVRTLVGTEGTPPLVLHFHPPKVVYKRTVTKTEDYVEVTGRTRLPLCSLTEDSVSALGFDELDDVVDAFCTDHGGLPEQSVWLIEFRFACDMPNILAWPNWGKSGHDDYVTNAGARDALHHEPEAIDKQTLGDYAAQARRARSERVGEIERLEARRKEIRRRAARMGVHPALELAVIERQIADARRDQEAA